MRALVPLPPVRVPGGEVRFHAPAEVQVDLEAGRDGILARVRARAQGSAACDRCLGPVTVPIALDYEERFQTPAQAAASPAGAGDEERRVLYEGDVIDLVEGLRENLTLALPLKFLCREGCRGLCPRCGQNLNEGECGCRVEEPARPLEALRPLLERFAREQDKARN